MALVITVVQIIYDRDTYQCRFNQCVAVTHVLVNREVKLNTSAAGIFLYQDLGQTGSELLFFFISMETDTCSSHRVIMRKTMLPIFPRCFSCNLLYTCEEMHAGIPDRFGIQSDPITDCRVSSFERLKKKSHRLIIREILWPLICDWIFFILVCNKNTHESFR